MSLFQVMKKGTSEGDVRRGRQKGTSERKCQKGNVRKDMSERKCQKGYVRKKERERQKGNVRKKERERQKGNVGKKGRVRKNERERQKGYSGMCILFLLAYSPSVLGGCKTIIKKNVTLDGKFNAEKTPIVSTTAIFQIGCASECKKPCQSLYYNGRSKKCLIYDSPVDSDLDKYVADSAAENWSKIVKCSTEPVRGCKGGWCLLYPILIAVVVLVIIVLVVIVALCLKKRYQAHSQSQ
ncbi:hypothetical protein LOTGIDRAFT_173976 [Lottia gigantea]|uniref:Apple domain-containing protein n=1 Tax=Lottia gigantea TaxID=225164 RepID=V4APC4_LOTGI|nr:hypothetical protein LOTGIDRAFT_173976 [Lottia gigantea]ESO99047.1 hypothetical protein LOTGIDRAFT_173976 [Lottia gigantea]